MKAKWTVLVQGKEHTVIYLGKESDGSFNIELDGIGTKYATYLDGRELSINLDIAGEYAEIKTDPHGENPSLILSGNRIVGTTEGTYIDTSVLRPVNSLGKSTFNDESLGAIRKIKRGMSSFLMMVILTFINMGLIIFNVPLNFPFSASVPPLLVELGVGLRENNLAIFLVLTAAAVVVVLIYLLLYFLAKKHTLPVWIALVMIIVDFGILIWVYVGLYSESILLIIIDIAFHVWVIASLIGLIRAKNELEKTMNQDMD